MQFVSLCKLYCLPYKKGSASGHSLKLYRSLQNQNLHVMCGFNDDVGLMMTGPWTGQPSMGKGTNATASDMSIGDSPARERAPMPQLQTCPLVAAQQGKGHQCHSFRPMSISDSPAWERAPMSQLQTCPLVTAQQGKGHQCHSFRPMFQTHRSTSDSPAWERAPMPQLQTCPLVTAQHGKGHQCHSWLIKNRVSSSSCSHLNSYDQPKL